MALARTLRRLEGKFLVANQRCSVSLPDEFRLSLHDSNIVGIGAAGTRWCAFSLHEPTAVTIQHASDVSLSADASMPARFLATIPYRLVATAGQGVFENANEETDWIGDAMHDTRVTAACPWFRVGLCIPDVDALVRKRLPQAAEAVRPIPALQEEEELVGPLTATI